MPDTSPLVYLVTGCSSGIGRAIARRAAADGHRVFATARRIESIRDLVRVGSVDSVELDVTKSESIRRAVDEINVGRDKSFDQVLPTLDRWAELIRQVNA